MAVPFSISALQEEFAKLKNQHFDLIVIGGGITGAGIALDAASRGIKTVLFEKDDFASGTSSRSTKLIHGGLRYLKQLEIGLVREVGTERAIVHRLAPHMVIPEKMLLPLVEDGTFGKWATSLGLWVYDVLAGVEDEDARIMLNKEQTQEKEPLLNPEKLVGGGYYAEYRTDDARLTIENIKKAVEFGALAFSYTSVENFTYEEKKITGVEVVSQLTGEKIRLKSKYVINAAGPWVDRLRKKDKSLKGKRLHLTKGVHLVVSHKKLPVKQAVYFDVPDGRMIFAIPRGKITYIGTTDTEYHNDPEEVQADKNDAVYLLNAVNNTFPSVNLTVSDVISTWAGLRPLIHEDGKSASELSRKDEIFESESGLLSIAGGKLTGYRKMAERIIDKLMERIADQEGVVFKKCFTDQITLPGGDFENYQAVTEYISEISQKLISKGASLHTAWYLVTTFGTQTDEILKIVEENGGGKDIEEDIVMAELEFCFKHEMVSRPSDFFIQRTGRLYFDIQSITSYLDKAIVYFSEKLAWNTDKIDAERIKVLTAIEKATACIHQSGES